MALLRSDVLNISCFTSALEQSEKTASVEVLEITLGDGRSGWLQEVAPVQVLAKVRGRSSTFSWTAKISPAAEAAAILCAELRLFEREVFVYRQLLPSIELRWYLATLSNSH